MLGLWDTIVAYCHFLISNDGCMRVIEKANLARIAKTVDDFVAILKAIPDNQQREVLLLRDASEFPYGGNCAMAKAIFLAGISSQNSSIALSDGSIPMAQHVVTILEIAEAVLPPQQLKQLFTEDQPIQLPSTVPGQISTGNLVSFCASISALSCDEPKKVWNHLCAIIGKCFSGEVERYNFLVHSCGKVLDSQNGEVMTELFGSGVVLHSAFKNKFPQGASLQSNESRTAFVSFIADIKEDDLGVVADLFRRPIYSSEGNYIWPGPLCLTWESGQNILLYAMWEHGKGSPQYKKIKAFLEVLKRGDNETDKIIGCRNLNGVIESVEALPDIGFPVSRERIQELKDGQFAAIVVGDSGCSFASYGTLELNSDEELPIVDLDNNPTGTIASVSSLGTITVRATGTSEQDFVLDVSAATKGDENFRQLGQLSATEISTLVISSEIAGNMEETLRTVLNSNSAIRTVIFTSEPGDNLNIPTLRTDFPRATFIVAERENNPQ
ncbi:MAG: hypothetical protein LBF24_03965 [Puniceicoccales bacterium]|nr:hypothetical protein [Puniceicoccales bacterium]